MSTKNLTLQVLHGSYIKEIEKWKIFKKKVRELLIQEDFSVDFVYFGVNLKQRNYDDVYFKLAEENSKFIILRYDKGQKKELLRTSNERLAILIFYCFLKSDYIAAVTRNNRVSLFRSPKSIPEIISEYHTTYTNDDFDLTNKKNEKMRYFLKKEGNNINLGFKYNADHNIEAGGPYDNFEQKGEKRSIVVLMNKNYLIYAIYLTVEELEKKGIYFPDFEQYIPFILGNRYLIDHYNFKLDD